jgi:hypothetical protein
MAVSSNEFALMDRNRKGNTNKPEINNKNNNSSKI